MRSYTGGIGLGSGVGEGSGVGGIGKGGSGAGFGGVGARPWLRIMASPLAETVFQYRVGDSSTSCEVLVQGVCHGSRARRRGSWRLARVDPRKPRGPRGAEVVAASRDWSYDECVTSCILEVGHETASADLAVDPCALRRNAAAPCHTQPCWASGRR